MTPAVKYGIKHLVGFIRQPDIIYQVFFSVVDSRGQTHPASATKVQVVLVRDPSMPYGFIVLTAYPKP